MRHREHRETLTGIGRVWHNDKVALVSVGYRIELSQTVHVDQMMDGSTSRVGGIGHIEGMLLTTATPYNLIGEPIELELEDGRRWKCFIQSTRGNLMNSGGIS